MWQVVLSVWLPVLVWVVSLVLVVAVLVLVLAVAVAVGWR